MKVLKKCATRNGIHYLSLTSGCVPFTIVSLLSSPEGEGTCRIDSPSLSRRPRPDVFCTWLSIQSQKSIDLPYCCSTSCKYGLFGGHFHRFIHLSDIFFTFSTNINLIAWRWTNTDVDALVDLKALGARYYPCICPWPNTLNLLHEPDYLDSYFGLFMIILQPLVKGGSVFYFGSRKKVFSSTIFCDYFISLFRSLCCLVNNSRFLSLAFKVLPSLTLTWLPGLPCFLPLLALPVLCALVTKTYNLLNRMYVSHLCIFV